MIEFVARDDLYVLRGLCEGVECDALGNDRGIMVRHGL